MLYSLRGKFYYTSPKMIKRLYAARINDYLMKKSEMYKSLSPADRSIRLEDIVSGIQIPEIYKKEAFVKFDYFDFSLHELKPFLYAYFLKGKFKFDYKTAERSFLARSIDEAEKIFIPSYKKNGELGELSYAYIFDYVNTFIMSGDLEYKVMPEGRWDLYNLLEACGFCIPGQAKDIRITVRKSSFVVKSSNTMQSLYAKLIPNAHFTEKIYDTEERVFATIGGELYHNTNSGDISDPDSFLKNKSFWLDYGVTDEESRANIKKRFRVFIKDYFSIPKDTIDYTVSELEKLFIPRV